MAFVSMGAGSGVLGPVPESEVVVVLAVPVAILVADSTGPVPLALVMPVDMVIPDVVEAEPADVDWVPVRKAVEAEPDVMVITVLLTVHVWPLMVVRTTQSAKLAHNTTEK